MAKVKRGSNRIDADYPEELVGIMLESFLTFLSFPSMRYSIEPFSRKKERWLGADARLNGRIRGFRPFYMQFKKPSAYSDLSSSKIIKNRKSCNLQTSPNSLFFPLRAKTLKQSDYQHNVLLRLRQKLQSRGVGDAAYVCPLFLDRSAYRHNMHWAGIRHWFPFWGRHPFHSEDIILHGKSTSLQFDTIPVLAEHISIPPHASVTSAKHSYSFDESGKQLCFHSPLSLPEGVTSFVDFLKGVSREFFMDGERFNQDSARKELLDVIKAVDPQYNTDAPKIGDEPSRDDPIGSWLAWGDYLRTEYEIEQFALIDWNEE